MELGIIIPSRNEMFLRNTIEDILKHIESDTEIIALLDGQWADPPIPQHERVNVIYVGKSVGQRAGADLAAKLSKAKYIMKVDAHCAFDQGFDRKMIEGFAKVGDNVTMVPVMRNLHAFDWVCENCNWSQYQGPTPTICPTCNKTDSIKRKMIWEPKPGVRSTSYCFDCEPHFQYFEDFKHRPEYESSRRSTGFTESMSTQGSCFMTTRDKYWELGLGDGSLGNWGNQGIQIACATWLSGGRVLCNHNTWYAHMFRTQGGDFGFPYPLSGRETKKTKDTVWDMFKNMKHPKQIYPVSWLIEKFSPVPGWNEESIRNLKEHESTLDRQNKV